MSGTSEVHFVGKIAQKALIVKEDKILITRDPRNNDVWELPGGRLNEGEEPKSGLAREIFEELGITALILDAVYVEQFMHKKDNSPHLLIAYTATIADDCAFVFSDEVAEVKWISEEDYREHTFFENNHRAIAAFFKEHR